MKLYLAESKQDRAGYRDSCLVWADSPEQAAQLGGDYMDSGCEYLRQVPAEPATPRALMLLDCPQWHVTRIGRDYILR